MPIAEHHEVGVEVGEGAAVLGRAAERAAQVAQLGEQQRRAGLRAGEADEGVDRLVGQLARSARRAPSAGHRLLGVHVDPAEAGGGIWSKVSMIGSPISRSGAIAASPSPASPMQAPSIVSSGLPRSGSGTSGIGGGRRKRTIEVTSSGDARRPVAVGADRVGADLGREEQRAGVDLGDRQQVDVQRGDDRVAAAAAAQRPEEVGVVLGVDRARLAVGGDQLDRA